MYLPPLQPVANSDIRICGDVEIHPTASIAPGVILQAAPDSRIIIDVDACIGMGVIISAYGGVVTIASGATLGSGVLIVGNSQVGNNACVGTASTIFNASVDSMAVISPGSIIGDISRQTTTNQFSPQTENKTAASNGAKANTSSSHQTEEIAEKFIASEKIPETTTNNHNSQGKILEKERISSTDTNSKAKKQVLDNEQVVEDPSDPWSEKNLQATDVKELVDLAVEEIEKSDKVDEIKAIGKVYINELLVTLFPHKKHFNNNSTSQ
ncbi:conserved hypothetical protein [Hyella patelloides LEGE 07179]|uniref:Carbon dioxide concentrating mechanism protein n=1 Tax=Hyella patelloides LEGE 07179 TaxID=945734 RepID=A0A563W3C7_9CYAN|nr:carbon dioxide concentrating mechanism protein [Hyella patelloides]VEP18127.1 conserved hypothetical protein [Hyella patelloides LEGE 07179]